MLTVTFDRLLRTGTSGPGNWWATQFAFPSTRHDQIGPAVVLNDTVTAQLKVAGPGLPPPGFCRYDAIPPDVFSRPGVPAAPFPQYPIVEIP